MKNGFPLESVIFFTFLQFLFKYSCLYFYPTTAPCSTYPQLPPSNLPPLALSMCLLYMFLDGPSPIFTHYPSPQLKKTAVKWGGNQPDGKIYLPTIPWTRVWSPKYIQNSHDSTPGRQTTQLKNGPRTWTDTSPRRTYRGPRDIWKDSVIFNIWKSVTLLVNWNDWIQIKQMEYVKSFSPNFYFSFIHIQEV